MRKRRPLAIICTHITAANVAVAARMLTGHLARRGYRPFGLCAECRHFLRDAADGAPHRCGLLALPLSAEDAGAICIEQEVA